MQETQPEANATRGRRLKVRQRRAGPSRLVAGRKCSQFHGLSGYESAGPHHSRSSFGAGGCAPPGSSGRPPDPGPRHYPTTRAGQRPDRRCPSTAAESRAPCAPGEPVFLGREAGARRAAAPRHRLAVSAADRECGDRPTGNGVAPACSSSPKSRSMTSVGPTRDGWRDARQLRLRFESLDLFGTLGARACSRGDARCT